MFFPAALNIAISFTITCLVTLKYDANSEPVIAFFSLTKFFIMVGITSLLVVSLCFTCFGASVKDVKNNVSGSLTFTYYYKAEDISSLLSSLFYTSDFGSYHHFTPAYSSMEQFPYKSYVSCSSSINVESPVDIYIGVDSGYYEWDLSSSSLSPLPPLAW